MNKEQAISLVESYLDDLKRIEKDHPKRAKKVKAVFGREPDKTVAGGAIIKYFAKKEVGTPMTFMLFVGQDDIEISNPNRAIKTALGKPTQGNFPARVPFDDFKKSRKMQATLKKYFGR